MKGDQGQGISIVIPSWNNKETLMKCLSALETQTALEIMEVIIADDGSDDGSAEEVGKRKWKFHLKYLALPHRGLAAASNAGIMAAEKEYILHMGSDIIAVPEMVEQHLRTLSENSNAAVIGYCPYSSEIRVTPFMNYLMNSGRQFGYGALEDGERGLPPNMFYTSNVSFEKNKAVEVGLFDEDMGWLYQDCEFGIRMIMAGVTIHYNKKARGYHYHSIALDKWITREIHSGESLVKLSLKHPWFKDLHSIKDYCYSFYYSIRGKDRFRKEIHGLIEKLEEKPLSLLRKLALDTKEGHGIIHSHPVLDYHYDKLLNFYNGMGMYNAISAMEGENWADEKKTGVWIYHDSAYAKSAKIAADRKTGQKLVSVVIPVYNGKDTVRQTVESFFNQSISRDEIELVLVDDGSDDETKKCLAGLEKMPGVKVLYSERNRGQSISTNQGVIHSSGYYIMLSAQDILADPRLLESHLQTHNRAEDEVAVMGNIPYADSLVQNKLMQFVMDGGPQFAFENINNHENVTPPFLYAPNITLKKEVFEKVGGFDDDFVYGAQDTDLGVRLRLNNIRIIYNPHAIAYHNHFLKLDTFLFKRQPLAGKGMVQYTVKWPFLNNLEAIKSNIYSHYIIYRDNKKLLNDMLAAAALLDAVPSERHPTIIVRECSRRNISQIPAYTFILDFLLSYYLYRGAMEEMERREGRGWSDFYSEEKGRMKFFRIDRENRNKERILSAILSRLPSGEKYIDLVDDTWPDRKIYVQNRNDSGHRRNNTHPSPDNVFTRKECKAHV